MATNLPYAFGTATPEDILPVWKEALEAAEQRNDQDVLARLASIRGDFNAAMERKFGDAALDVDVLSDTDIGVLHIRTTAVTARGKDQPCRVPKMDHRRKKMAGYLGSGNVDRIH